jgi:hypothetical protein
MQWQKQAYAVPPTVKALPTLTSRRVRTLIHMGLYVYSVVAHILGVFPR